MPLRHRPTPVSLLLAATALTACLTPTAEMFAATLNANSDYSLFFSASDLPGITSSINSDAIAETLVAIIEDSQIDLIGSNPLSLPPVLEVESPESRVLSFKYLIESFSQLRWDLDGNPVASEVPLLPQTSFEDINQGVYDFPATPVEPSETAAEPTSQPDASPATAPAPQTAGIPVPVGAPTASGSDSFPLPRYGGPLAIVALPQTSGRGTPSPVSPPSVNRTGVDGVGDGTVDVSFSTEPKTQIVDINTFLRTRYRQNVSDMLEKLEARLRTKVEVELPTMPRNVIGNPYPRQVYSPSSDLQPSQQKPAVPTSLAPFSSELP